MTKFVATLIKQLNACLLLNSQSLHTHCLATTRSMNQSACKVRLAVI